MGGDFILANNGMIIYWRNQPSLYLDNNTLPNDVVTLVIFRSGETIEGLITK